MTFFRCLLNLSLSNSITTITESSVELILPACFPIRFLKFDPENIKDPVLWHFKEHPYFRHNTDIYSWILKTDLSPSLSLHTLRGDLTLGQINDKTGNFAANSPPLIWMKNQTRLR